jgi:uncharacterized damage-inducible protein DinB
MSLGKEYISQVNRRMFTESVPRLLHCIEEISDEQLWWSPNENSNSIGNLVLHLTGNINQWINSGLGGDEDTRTRQSEFDNRKDLDRAELIDDLNLAMDRARQVIEQLEPADLQTTYKVQGFTESGVSILMHVVEHLSYHVGQVTYIVKYLKNIDTGYYAGDDLDVTGD